MNKALNMPEKLSFPKAALLSLLIHGFLLSTFILIFPVSQLSFKPEFLFLGPILQPQDIYAFSRPSKPSPQLYNKFFKNTDPGDKPFSFSESSKPRNLTMDKSKIHVDKSMFYDSSQETKKHTLKIEELNFDLKLPPYKPLKYNPDDQN